MKSFRKRSRFVIVTKLTSFFIVIDAKIRDQDLIFRHRSSLLVHEHYVCRDRVRRESLLALGAFSTRRYHVVYDRGVAKRSLHDDDVGHDPRNDLVKKPFNVSISRALSPTARSEKRKNVSRPRTVTFACLDRSTTRSRVAFDNAWDSRRD